MHRVRHMNELLARGRSSFACASVSERRFIRVPPPFFFPLPSLLFELKAPQVPQLTRNVLI